MKIGARGAPDMAHSLARHDASVDDTVSGSRTGIDLHYSIFPYLWDPSATCCQKGQCRSLGKGPDEQTCVVPGNVFCALTNALPAEPPSFKFCFDQCD